MKKKLVIVLGMHRSGTSVITRALTTLGISLGDELLPPMPDNSKGFWEDTDIVELNDLMLSECDSSWHSLTKISEEDHALLKQRGYVLRLKELIKKKLKKDDLLGIKDPRIPKLIGIWSEVISSLELEVQYVVSVRNPLSVAHSLKKRNRLETQVSCLLWLEHVINILEFTKDEDALFVEYDNIIKSPEHELNRLSSWLSLPITKEKANEYYTTFLDQNLMHANHSLKSLEINKEIPKICLEIHQYLHDLSKEQATSREICATNLLKNWYQTYNLLGYLDKSFDKAQSKEKQAIAEAQHAKAEAQHAKVEAKQSIAEAHAEVQHAQAQADGAKAEIQALLQTTSWKITEPLRHAAQYLKKYLE